MEATPESPDEQDSVVTYNDSVTLVDQSDTFFSRTNSVDGGDDDSAGDVTIRLDSSS